jgi:hypothetical protein
MAKVECHAGAMELGSSNAQEANRVYDAGRFRSQKTKSRHKSRSASKKMTVAERI